MTSAPACDGTGKAPTSPTSNPTDPDQANPPQDSQAHLKAILDVVRELESAIDELRQVVSQIAKQ